MDLSLMQINAAKFVIILEGRGGTFLKIKGSKCVIKQKFYSWSPVMCVKNSGKNTGAYAFYR